MQFEEFEYVPQRFEIGVYRHQTNINLLKQYLSGVAYGPGHISGIDAFFDFKKIEEGYLWCVQQGCAKSPLDHIARVFELSPDAENEEIIIPFVRSNGVASIKILSDYGVIEDDEVDEYSPIEFDRPMTKAQDEQMTFQYAVLFFVIAFALLGWAVAYRWLIFDTQMPVKKDVLFPFQQAALTVNKGINNGQKIKQVVLEKGRWSVDYEK